MYESRRYPRLPGQRLEHSFHPRQTSVDAKSNHSSFRLIKAYSNWKKKTEISLYPYPAQLRSSPEMEGWWTWRIIVIVTSLLSVIGGVISCYGADLLTREAYELKQHGVDHLSLARYDHLGQRGWAWISGGYALTFLESVIALMYGIYSTRSPSLLNAFPECEFNPHMIRNSIFAIGDLCTSVVASIASARYDYGHEPNSENITPFEQTYIDRMTDILPYLLFGAAGIRVFATLVVCVSFERLNIFYWICCCRCKLEWDSLSGDAAHRKLQRREAEDHVIKFNKLLDEANLINDPNSRAIQLRNKTAAPVCAKWPLSLSKKLKAIKKPVARKLSTRSVKQSTPSSRKAPDEPIPPEMSPLILDTEQRKKNDMLLANEEFDKIPAWRKVLHWYQGPLNCNVQGQYTVDGVKLRGYWPCLATLAHNWWGALRSHLYLSAILMLWASSIQIHTGHYDVWHPSASQQYTWPVYIPLFGVEPLKYQEYATNLEDLYGIAPPPSPHAPSGEPPFSPTPPSLPNPPAFPPHPPTLPPMPPFTPDVALERAFHGASTTPYPPELSDQNDSSAFMGDAARIMLAAEVFRTVAYIAYWVGVVRNEASVPRNHLPKKGGLIALFP